MCGSSTIEVDEQVDHPLQGRLPQQLHAAADEPHAHQHEQDAHLTGHDDKAFQHGGARLGAGAVLREEAGELFQLGDLRDEFGALRLLPLDDGRRGVRDEGLVRKLGVDGRDEALRLLEFNRNALRLGGLVHQALKGEVHRAEPPENAGHREFRRVGADLDRRGAERALQRLDLGLQLLGGRCVLRGDRDLHERGGAHLVFGAEGAEGGDHLALRLDEVVDRVREAPGGAFLGRVARRERRAQDRLAVLQEAELVVDLLGDERHE